MLCRQERTAAGIGRAKTGLETLVSTLMGVLTQPTSSTRLVSFPSGLEERVDWISALQSLQNPETGLFEESTHHTIHTTAHCIAALELFDAKPLHKLTSLRIYTDPEELRHFLSDLEWRGNPWRESHRGAGLFAAMVIADEVDLAWQDAYFSWLWQNTDPETGLLAGKNLPRVTHSGTTTMVPHMAGTFHYLFNMQWARRPSRYPERLIDVVPRYVPGAAVPPRTAHRICRDRLVLLHEPQPTAVQSPLRRKPRSD